VRIIGYGGFGNTYLAFDQTFKNHCVVKEFALDMICTRDSTNATISILHKREGEMAKWLDKFTEEARNLSLIRHLGVVNAFDIWREKGTAFYAMEHIEGGELPDSAVKTWKPMAWTKAKKLAIAILEALKAVHEVGLLHGDIKPANILIDKKTKQPILIDFGTARSLKKAQDKTVTSLAYTIGYAPIELQDRTRSKEANSSSDLYSWAMVVIGLIKKHRDKGLPIDAKTRIMLNRVNADEYSEKFLQKWLSNSLPTSVISILANCLRLDSNQRPQSANVVLKQLKNSERNQLRQDPFYPQNQSSFNSGIKNENTVIEQDNNKTVLERNHENIHLKQNKNNFRTEKTNKQTNVKKTKTNKLIIFALLVGIIGIGFVFVETKEKLESARDLEEIVLTPESSIPPVVENSTTSNVRSNLPPNVEPTPVSVLIEEEGPTERELDRAFRSAIRELERAAVIPLDNRFSLQANVDNAVATMNGVLLPNLPIVNVFVSEIRPFTVIISADGYESLEITFERSGGINYVANLEEESFRSRSNSNSQVRNPFGEVPPEPIPPAPDPDPEPRSNSNSEVRNPFNR